MLERIKDMWRAYPKLLIGGVIGCLLLFGVGFYFINQQIDQNNSTNAELFTTSKTISKRDQQVAINNKKNNMSEKQENLNSYVDIKGAVKRPGVYKIQKNYRLESLIALAHGPTKNADLNQVNLAQVLVDQMVIYIPKKNEKIPVQFNSVNMTEKSETAASNQEKSIINLNTANQEDLLTLTGVGPSKAAAILQYRQEHGQFNNIDELKEVSGIGEKTFDKIKDVISV